MKKYEWVFFDADETLFSFDAYAGLKKAFKPLGVDFSQQDYLAYEAVNQPLWVQYQNGEVTSRELQHKRFEVWSQKLDVTPQELNSAFLTAMTQICKPLDGVVNLLNALKGNTKLGIITNGFVENQESRLEATGLKSYFDLLVISEQVGFAKPHPGIFHHTFAQIGHPPPNQVLMVGDNPIADILGGMNAGIDTCWLNASKKLTPQGVTPNYHVSSLMELHEILFPNKKVPQ